MKFSLCYGYLHFNGRALWNTCGIQKYLHNYYWLWGFFSLKRLWEPPESPGPWISICLQYKQSDHAHPCRKASSIWVVVNILPNCCFWETVPETCSSHESKSIFSFIVDSFRVIIFNGANTVCFPWHVSSEIINHGCFALICIVQTQHRAYSYKICISL